MAHSRAPSRDPDLDHDTESGRDAILCAVECTGEEADPSEGVNVHNDLECGARREGVPQPRGLTGIEKFVGEERRIDTPAVNGAQLLRVGHGRTPRARVVLAVEELSRHRGLHMGCVDHAELLACAGHRRDVVVDAVVVEGEKRPPEEGSVD